MKKIICLGNRFAYPDSYGIEVYNQLSKDELGDIELIEGGIGGLNLSLYFDSEDDILLVDHGVGYDKKLFDLHEIDLSCVNEYNHDTAFLYLLKSIEKKNIKLYLSNNSKWQSEQILVDCKEIISLVGEV